ncbi:hypothetical protein PROSTU_04189 [Providencia stuartii ATCC 25827]|uniref:Uncharacterized protein n=1 Tax=Providencia stuartii ATCC 25827 TaxID=471874 RepID=A0AA86YI08_PROST|nr:hypothetical protein PROSTU_04189 [Providencia stuartii ATCC 25827]
MSWFSPYLVICISLTTTKIDKDNFKCNTQSALCMRRMGIFMMD